MTEAEFLSRGIPEPNTGCLLWDGALFVSYGYGAVRMWGRTMRAHRLSWHLRRGPIPDGMVVCHRCDTPPCINPDHLFLGTHADNSMDATKKGRVPHGDQHRSAILDSASVLEIKSLLATGELHRSIAARFGVRPATVRQIEAGVTWTRVGPAMTARGHQRGARHKDAKLTERDVRQIRSESLAGASRASLGRRYGVAAETISGIVHRKTWRCLR